MALKKIYLEGIMTMFLFDKEMTSPINSKVFNLLLATGLLAALSSKHTLQNEFERYSKKLTAIGLSQYLQ
jgi:hypothetical protein